MVGLSPAFAHTIWLSLSGLTVAEVLRQVLAGIEEEGALARVVQNGRAVVLIDDRGAPAVAVTVTLQDRVMWRARASASAR